jgi:molybdate/tungstate transport system ATP-binding protein
MIEVRAVSVSAGTFALRDVSFTIGTGRYAALMGRTGCGKTTLLEAISGLRPIRSGRILLGGRDVTELAPGARGIGYVPQDRALFSTMTVREHLAFALEIRKRPGHEINRRVSELSELLGIVALLPRRPIGLSGGEAQRVALGRALSFHPGILLLDEPLSALDEQTRQEMYDLLRHVREVTGVTTLHVTHQRGEAEMLADQVLLMEQGVVRAQP